MRTHPWLSVLGLTLTLGGCDTSGGLLGPGSNDPGGTNGSGGGNNGSVGSTGAVGGGSTGFLPPPPANLPLEPVVAKRTPPAISGGTLAISPDGKLAVAADSDRDKIFITELATDAIRTIELSQGSEPGRVAFDSAGRAHVALRRSGELVQIDPVAGTILKQTAVCGHPRGVAYRASGNAMLVACADGDLVALSADDHAERLRSQLDLDLRDVVVTKDGKTLVSTFRTAELIEVDLKGVEVRRLRPATGRATRFNFDPVAGTDPGPKDVTLVPRVAWRTVLDADGQPLMLHQRSQVEEVVVGPGGYGGGCSSVTEATIANLSTTTPNAGMSLGFSTMAVDFAVSRSGAWLVVAAAGGFLQGNAGVQVYSATGITTPPPPGSEFPEPPGGGCTGTTAEGAHDSQVVAVSFGPDNTLYAQSREPARLQVFSLVEETSSSGDGGIAPSWVALNLKKVIQLDAESVRDTGHDLFHANVGGGIACASCHPEGRDDGHTWTFAGFGPRRTQNMGGGLAGTEPFHWDGDMTSFQHLVDEVMTGRMGGFVVEPKYAKSLLGWIDHIPALTLSARRAASVSRGEALFSATGCGSCHSGAMLTNNATADVGTGGPFQVPSLRGLGLRGPFMHNGCAADLVGRFDPKCGGGDKHGKTSTLSNTQIADLSAYLSTL